MEGFAARSVCHASKKAGVNVLVGCAKLERHGKPDRIVIDGSQTNREALR
jgi:hypothetical protein